MKLKLPKFFKVFGLKVRVKVLPMSEHIAGTYTDSEKLIMINDLHETEDELMHTLLHELGHCLFYRVSINQSVSREVHEYIVNNYSTMLLENFDITPKK